ncbi:MAG: hypothetical protein OXN25_14965 [Candidatus Poribacteria bacterium]|nr:hypothetical protein [Candidatus Poribacteria bacterium]
MKHILELLRPSKNKKTTKMPEKCSQCKKPAILEVADNHLCVDCYSKLQQANYLDWVIEASILNYQNEELEHSIGLGYKKGRIHIPMPNTIKTGDFMYHNIRVDNSVVGTINTGNIGKLDVNMHAMRAENKRELADILQQLTQAILDATDIKAEDKNSALEWLSFLSNQALTPKSELQPTMGQTAISALEKILTNTGSVASIWSVAEPLLKNLF